MRLPPQNNLSRPKKPFLKKTVGIRRLAVHSCGSECTVSFLPAWQRERAKILHRACLSLHFHVERGNGLLKSSRIVARRYSGRTFKADASRRLRLSAQTLTRLYHIWQSSGKVPAAFALRYRNARPKINRAKLSAFLRAALQPDTASYRAAYNICGETSATESAFHRALSRRIAAPLSALFAHRRKTLRLKRRVLAAIVTIENGGKQA